MLGRKASGPPKADSGVAKRCKTLEYAFRVFLLALVYLFALGKLGLFYWQEVRKMKNLFPDEKNQRVVTFLNRDEVDFLDKIGKDALFSTGLKVSRAKLISWLVDFRLTAKG
jgi:hypothetical protein